jgi:hypothetical protein
MENCFALFVHTAMRFHASWMLLRQATGSNALPSWIISVVQATIKGVCATVRGRVAQIHRGAGIAAGTGEAASLSLCKTEITSLGLHAFIAVFSKRFRWYSAVVPALRRLLEQHVNTSASEGQSRVITFPLIFKNKNNKIYRCAPGGDSPLHSGRNFSAHFVLTDAYRYICSHLNLLCDQRPF